ncbi:hypothetical protein NF27_DP01180 [Candidatus Jidaibacter acanthamoeba]|uniref:Leucine-binding protein domain-containing protein n=2 Tax=Candidatus Jidaibacter acanthamoebae TaxID=86105 RepID=A0A0C1QJ86_9RICK|nr:hypothetical protein NF27_DP01180 [Candidatus Jidaibacter acanthamoeba]
MLENSFFLFILCSYINLQLLFMLKKIFIVLSLLTLTGCTSNNVDNKQVELQPIPEKNVSENHRRLEVALLLPLSGEHAEIGNNMLQATRLALHELKVSQVNINPIDIGSDIAHPEEILNLLDEKKYDIIVGPIFSHHTKVIYSYAYKHQIPLISFSNDISLLNNEGLFLIGIMPDQVINRVVNYAALEGYNKLFGLLPENRYGLYIENILKNNAEGGNYQVIDIARYIHSHDTALTNAQNALTIIKAAILKQAAVEGNNTKSFALLMPEGGEFTYEITKDMYAWAEENKIKLKFLGSPQWDNKKLVSAKHLNGAWIAAAPNLHLKNFEQRFYDNNNVEPFKISALAYDAAALLAVLSTKDNILEALLDDGGFQGASGIFRFKKDGSNERMLSIFEIEKGELKEIDPAGSSF